MSEQHTAYLAASRKYNLRAARALDRRRVGRLQLEDVIDGLLPGSRLNRTFTRHLPSLLTCGVLPEWRPSGMEPKQVALQSGPAEDLQAAAADPGEESQAATAHERKTLQAA